MAESHVVTGLVAKRAELAGLIQHHRQEVRKMEDVLTHLDATLKLFAPDMDLRSLRAKEHRQRNHYFRPGEAPRTILDVLRHAAGPLTSRLIVETILTARGEALAPERFDGMQKTILTCLRSLERKGRVAVAPTGQGNLLAWTIA